jgi:hypothetical protein
MLSRENNYQSSGPEYVLNCLLVLIVLDLLFWVLTQPPSG